MEILIEQVGLIRIPSANHASGFLFFIRKEFKMLQNKIDKIRVSISSGSLFEICQTIMDYIDNSNVITGSTFKIYYLCKEVQFMCVHVKDLLDIVEKHRIKDPFILDRIHSLILKILDNIMECKKLSHCITYINMEQVFVF